MQLPLQITFRDIDPSPAIEEAIREKADKLDRHAPRIISCRVVVETPHKHQHKGKQYQVRIDLSIPGDEIVVNREPNPDVYVAIRDAFQAAERQLKDYRQRRRGDTKQHDEQPHGRVVRLFPDEGYGFIATADGREVYFHRNAVLETSFDKLAVGAEVRFSEELGEKGPQASTVRPSGKHPEL